MRMQSEPIGDLALGSVRDMSDRIKVRAMGSRVQGGVVAYVDAGEVYTAGRHTKEAERVERTGAVDVIGYYSNKATLGQIADDLLFVRDRLKVAA